MRIGVLESTQENSETPARHISKSRAERFIYRQIAKWVIVGKLLKMRKLDDEVRGDIEHFRSTGIPRIKRPRKPEGLLLYYPHRSQETWA